MSRAGGVAFRGFDDILNSVSDSVSAGGGRLSPREMTELETALKAANAGDASQVHAVLKIKAINESPRKPEIMKKLEEMNPGSTTQTGISNTAIKGSSELTPEKIAQVKAELANPARKRMNFTQLAQIFNRTKAFDNDTVLTKINSTVKYSDLSRIQKGKFDTFLYKLPLDDLRVLAQAGPNKLFREGARAKVAARVHDFEMQQGTNAVGQTPAQKAQARAKLAKQTAELAKTTDLKNAPNEVVNKLQTQIDILNSTKRWEKVGFFVGGLGIVASVVGIVVGIFVKPPYWNDADVQQGTGGAKPGSAEQKWVDWLNRMNENPAAVSASSCMSCICCCCCCCLLLVTMMGGGKKSGANVNF